MPRTTLVFDVNDRNARQGFDRLQRELRDTESGLQRTNRTARDTRGRFVAAGRGADVFTKSLGGARGLLVGLGSAVAARELIEFGAASVRAADQMESLRRGLEAIEGENATQRLRDFTEQSELSRSSQEYLQYAERIRDVNNELDTLRNIQGTRQTDNRSQRIQQSTEALERENAEIQRYTQLLANARAVAVGDTNPAIQQLERSLERSRATAAALTREIELLKNGFQDLVPAAATQTTANAALELEKLKAVAEDTRRAFTGSETQQQLTPNFQAALAASNAYYSERIRQAETALAKEKAGTDAFNELQVEIFQLGRQQVAAQRSLETERTSISRTSTQERVRIEQNTNNEIITGILSVVRAGREALRARIEFAQQIAAIPNIRSPDAQYGQFTAHLREDFRREAGEQDRQFIRNLRQQENREVQRELREQGRYYRQFANTLSGLFTGIATGRISGFEEVARQFIAQSLRIIARAFIEYQIQKKLDDSLTASKISNLEKVNAAQQAGGLAGNLPGLANLPGIGSLGGFLSGGAGALGIAGLLFPSASRNLLSGIGGEIKGFLDNISGEQRATVIENRLSLQIGDNEAREISDLQDALREESRA